jgi:tryptophan-rich sensory protein
MTALSGWCCVRSLIYAATKLHIETISLNVRPDLALVDIVLVWLSIVATIMLFLQVHVGAALLLIPYLAWVTFATALNLTIWRLNRNVPNEHA